MKRILAIATIATIISIPSVASAQPNIPPVACAKSPTGPFAPLAWVFVGTQCFDLSQYLTFGTNQRWTLTTPTLSLLGATISVNASYDYDPFITFEWDSPAEAQAAECRRDAELSDVADVRADL